MNTYNLKAFISKFEGHLVYVKRHGLSAFALGFSSSTMILTLTSIHIRLRWFQMRDRKVLLLLPYAQKKESENEEGKMRKETATVEGKQKEYNPRTNVEKNGRIR